MVPSFGFDESTKRAVKIGRYDGMMQREHELPNKLLSHSPDNKINILAEVKNRGILQNHIHISVDTAHTFGLTRVSYLYMSLFGALSHLQLKTRF